MRTQRNFKAKLIFVQLIAIIPLFLFVFYIFDLWYDTSRSAVLDSSISEAKFLANAVEEAFNVGVNTSLLLAANPILKANLNGKSTLLEETLRSVTDNLKDINAIAISDANGKTIAHSQELTPEQKGQITLSDRDYFQQVIADKKPVISDPVTSKFRGVQTIIMASPVVEGGKTVAVVLTAYDLDNLKAKLEKVLSVHENHVLLLFDKNKRLVFILYRPMPNEAEKILYNGLTFVTAKDQNKLIVIENQKLPSSDELYLGASVPVDGFGWTVVHLTPSEKMFAPLYKVQGMTWLILLSALLFALSLISYVMRKIKMVY